MSHKSTTLVGNDAPGDGIVGMTRNISKHSVMVRRREDLGRIIRAAFHIAATGRPGPAIVDLPKDVQLALGEDTYPETISMRGYKPSTDVHAGQIKRAATRLKQAEKPLILAGGGVKLSRGQDVLAVFVWQTGIPVIATVMGRGSVSTDDPLYFGNPGMHGGYAVQRPGDQRAGDLCPPCGADPYRHRHHGDLLQRAGGCVIVADAREALETLLAQCPDCRRAAWLERLAGWKQLYPVEGAEQPGVNPRTLLGAVNRLFEAPIVVTDVGQHQMWTAQLFQMMGETKFLISGGLGGMGYGFPAAIVRSWVTPGRTVLCISGDGGMQMNLQELATAVALELPVIICVFNNGYLGMVRQWQTLFYDRRYASTCTRRRRSCRRGCQGPETHYPPYTPDFVKLAESYGAKGVRVEREAEIEPAQRRTGPTLIEFILDAEELVLPMVSGGQSLNRMLLGEVEEGGCDMKKRWISLYVENDVGTLAKIAGLFAAKLNNLESLSVGPTADVSVSRLIIGLTGDDRTFEQVKKQLNRCVEVITVLDFTQCPVYSKELMYVRLSGCSASQTAYLEQLAEQAKQNVAERTGDGILLECLMDEACNSALIRPCAGWTGSWRWYGAEALLSGAGKAEKGAGDKLDSLCGPSVTIVFHAFRRGSGVRNQPHH